VADGPALGVVRRGACGLGEADGAASEFDLVTVFGVGDGLGATVRERFDGEVELLF